MIRKHIIEKWRPIPGFPGYQVSNLVRFRSLDRTVPTSNGRLRHIRGQFLKQTLSDKGYYRVSVKGKMRHVHQMVALSFKGACPKGMEVCHNNGVRTCNWPCNLRYDTHWNNVVDDAVLHGTFGLSKKVYPLSLVKAVRAEFKKGRFSRCEIARRFGVGRNTVYNWVSRQRRTKG